MRLINKNVLKLGMIHILRAFYFNLARTCPLRTLIRILKICFDFLLKAPTGNSVTTFKMILEIDLTDCHVKT